MTTQLPPNLMSAVESGLLSLEQAQIASLIAVGLTAEQARQVLYTPPASPSKSFATWSDDDLERLRTMWAEGYTGTQIAAALGRTIGAVHTRIAHERLLNPSSFPERSKGRPRLRG